MGESILRLTREVYERAGWTFDTMECNGGLIPLFRGVAVKGPHRLEGGASFSREAAERALLEELVEYGPQAMCVA